MDIIKRHLGLHWLGPLWELWAGDVHHQHKGSNGGPGVDEVTQGEVDG